MQFSLQEGKLKVMAVLYSKRYEDIGLKKARFSIPFEKYHYLAIFLIYCQKWRVEQREDLN